MKSEPSPDYDDVVISFGEFTFVAAVEVPEGLEDSKGEDVQGGSAREEGGMEQR